MDSATPEAPTTEDEKVHIVIYGCRGSIPVSGREFERYGGHTTSILLTSNRGKNVGIIDAGTGIHRLGQDLMKDPVLSKRPIIIAFTHFHWDHIQGLPFFAPAYVEGKRIALLALGRERGIDDLERVFSVQMQDEYFPVRLADMGARFEYLLPNEEMLLVPRGVVKARKHPHPGNAYSYRLETATRAIVICTDIEHGESLHEPTVEFCQGADLLIHDAQYTPEELETHRGWGHSSYEQAIQCAKRAGVKKLVLTHHDPDHDDEFLADIEAKSQVLFPNCVLARDRMSIEV